jgi:myosin-crossreactive antigen
MPEDTYTLWGYGLLIDADGDYVVKKMSQATGEEILMELIGQLGFDDIADEVRGTTDVTTVMMPYASPSASTWKYHRSTTASSIRRSGCKRLSPRSGRQISCR